MNTKLHIVTAIHKIQHKIIVTTLRKPGIKANILKSISKNSIANIILCDRRLKAFPLSVGTCQEWSLSVLPFHMVLEVPADVRERNKRHKDCKRRNEAIIIQEQYDSSGKKFKQIHRRIIRISEFRKVSKYKMKNTKINCI